MRNAIRFSAVAIIFMMSLSLGKVSLADDELESPMYELGLTLGTPAALNVVAGFWGTQNVPILVRASGMYYGDKVQGFQGELGWAFDREGSLKQAISAGFISTHLATDSSALDLTGAGPLYTLNWHGLTAQAGVAFGSASEIKNGRKTDIGPAQLLVQLGYTFLF